MSHSHPMSLDYAPAKRKLSPTSTHSVCNSQSVAHSHMSKRYKADNCFGDHEIIFTGGNTGYESKYGSMQVIKIPSRAEIMEAIRKEQYKQQVLAMLKKEQNNYLAELKGYNMPHCGFIGEGYECDEDPKLTRKKP